jgi:glycosyltransferase involved in cell wall biosynthesis
MKLVLFCHPTFSRSQSMPRFARNLKSSYESRGHEVDVWSPRPKAYRLFCNTRFAKWAGYLDQYVLFPLWVRRALKRTSADTMFVFCDQALGPWIPLIKNRPHVVHAHDFLALRSALGEIKENPTGLAGRIYQRYIRRGFQHARHFISVSERTREDLHRYGQMSPLTSECVYNCLSVPFRQVPEHEAFQVLQSAGLPAAPERMLLHVGGGQWYKNLPGVISIYAHYASRERDPLPLWCVSPKPNKTVQAQLKKVPPAGRVLFLSNLETATLQAAYSYARLLIFPSLAEGFGMPIIEALASGCSVLTTDEPPMNEIGGHQAHYIPRLKFGEDMDEWAARCAPMVSKLVAESASADPAKRADRAREWALRFEVDKAIDAYLAIYKNIFQSYKV